MSSLSPSDEAAVTAAIAAVPQLAMLGGRAALTVTRLGGLTNLVYKIEPPDSAAPLCLRVPGAGTERYIDRASERANAAAAARAGVGPEVLHFGDDGVMLMPLLPGATLSPEAFAAGPGVATRAGIALRKLHASGESFSSCFALFEQIDRYLAELGGDGAALPDGYLRVLASAEDVRAALAARPLPIAPCHCDPLCENFIDDGTRVWIIDFEVHLSQSPLTVSPCANIGSLRQSPVPVVAAPWDSTAG